MNATSPEEFDPLRGRRAWELSVGFTHGYSNCSPSVNPIELFAEGLSTSRSGPTQTLPRRLRLDPLRVQLVAVILHQVLQLYSHGTNEGLAGGDGGAEAEVFV